MSSAPCATSAKFNAALPTERSEWAMTPCGGAPARREKLSALRTDDYFRERAARANIGKAKRILKRAGKGKSPVPGDTF